MEEFAARFAIGTPGELTEVSRAGVNLARTVRTQVNRRDPGGYVAAGRPLHSTWTAAWNLSFSDDAGSIAVLLAALCDQGTDSIGDNPIVVPAAAAMELADGAEWFLDRGILREVQISLATGVQPMISTSWAFGRMRAVEFSADAVTEQWDYSTPAECSITLAGMEADVFSGTLSFSRAAEPAGFDEDGVCTWFAGRLAFDLVGTITVRLAAAADAFIATTGQFEAGLSLVLASGGHSLAVDVALATFLCRSRRIVSEAMVDYELELLALKSGTAFAEFTHTGGIPAVPL